MRQAVTVAIILFAGTAFGQDVECAAGLKMFVGRGTGEPPNFGTPPGAGETGNLAALIAEAIPGSNVEGIVYPATDQNPGYIQSVMNGSLAMQTAIAGYSEACSGSKIAVFGYSQGGQIATNAFCGNSDVWGGSEPLPDDVTENVIAIVLFGDPSHSNVSTYNRGTAEGSGCFPRYDYNACNSLGERIVSYCDIGDPFCDMSTPYQEGVHLNYLDVYGDEVVDFVVGQYGSGGNSSSNLTTTTPAPTSNPTDVSDSAALSSFSMIGLALASLTVFAF